MVKQPQFNSLDALVFGLPSLWNLMWIEPVKLIRHHLGQYVSTEGDDQTMEDLVRSMYMLYNIRS